MLNSPLLRAIHSASVQLLLPYDVLGFAGSKDVLVGTENLGIGLPREGQKSASPLISIPRYPQNVSTHPLGWKRGQQRTDI
jgi:hypothetical protein